MRYPYMIFLICTAFIMATPVPGRPAEPIKTRAVAGFVDFRQLLLRHPVFRKFDVATRRFNSTSSTWVADLEEARANYDVELKKLAAEQEKLTDQYNLLIKSSQPQKDSSTLKAIWEKLSMIKAEQAVIKDAKKATELKGNYLHGAGTGLESLIPLIGAISSDVLAVARSLSAKYDNIPILDLSCFQPPVPEQAPNRSILFKNVHTMIWQTEPDPESFSLWLKEFGRYLRQEHPQRFSHPFRHGVMDLRQEALSSMRFSTP